MSGFISSLRSVVWLLCFALGIGLLWPWSTAGSAEPLDLSRCGCSADDLKDFKSQKFGWDITDTKSASTLPMEAKRNKSETLSPPAAKTAAVTLTPAEAQATTQPASSDKSRLQPFQLTDHLGNPFDLQRLQGKWTFLFFGYTHCPDVCPIAIALLGEVFEQIKADPAAYAETQGVFVSVDPDRDTPALLKEYVAYFNPGFIGATGSQGQIFNLTSQVQANYMISPEEDEDGNYTVNHSTAFYIITPQGQLKAEFQPGTVSQANVAQQMASAFMQIRAGYNTVSTP